MKQAFKKRFRIFIYPRFQLALIFANLAIMSVIMGSVWYSVHDSFGRLVENGVKAGLAPNHPYFRLLNYQTTEVNRHILITFFIGSFISIIWMLILSNKLAGPILRLRGYFSKIGENGTFTEVTFRKGDFFIELPPLINRALRRLMEK